MSIEECKAATCAANPEAIASLLDGNGDLMALLVPEKDTQALIDLARYQHQVLSEIAETIDSSRDLLNCSARRFARNAGSYCARRQKRGCCRASGAMDRSRPVTRRPPSPHSILSASKTRL